MLFVLFYFVFLSVYEMAIDQFVVRILTGESKNERNAGAQEKRSATGEMPKDCVSGVTLGLWSNVHPRVNSDLAGRPTALDLSLTSARQFEAAGGCSVGTAHGVLPST